MTTVGALICSGISLYQLNESMQPVRGEINSLTEQLKQLLHVLEALDALLKDGGANNRLLSGLESTLGGTAETFKELEKLILANTIEKTGNGVARQWKKLKWTMQGSKVGELSKNLEAHKATLSERLLVSLQAGVDAIQRIESAIVQRSSGSSSKEDEGAKLSPPEPSDSVGVDGAGERVYWIFSGDRMCKEALDEMQILYTEYLGQFAIHTPINPDLEQHLLSRAEQIQCYNRNIETAMRYSLETLAMERR